MSAITKNTPRRVVPRWRSSGAAAAAGELVPLPVRNPDADPALEAVRAQETLERAARDFQQNRTVGYAGELLSAAVVLERPRAAIDAARFLLQHPESAGKAAILLARRIIATEQSGAETLVATPSIRVETGRLVVAVVRPSEDVEPKGQRQMVHDLRMRLRVNPRNPIAWLDLARVYATLGENEKAVRAARGAVTLSPDHRYILRSVARLLLHVERHDEAHALLRRSEATKHDPWLMAAEIAVATAANRPPRMVKTARAALASGRHSAFHLGELASALATVEANEGSTKAARKLFQTALIEPTENSIAQVEWASRFLRVVDFDPRLLAKPLTFEANTWAAYATDRWKEGLAHARRWIADEPFSGRAAGLGSVIAGVALEDFDVAIEFARQGILANPKDLVLRNNYVFTLAEAGHLDQAEALHTRIRGESTAGDARVVWLANGGLLAYRRGRHEEGRALYQQAAELASQMKRPALERIARAYWIGEELRAVPPGHEDGAEVDQVLGEAREQATPDLRIAIVRVERIRAKQRERTAM